MSTAPSGGGETIFFVAFGWGEVTKSKKLLTENLLQLISSAKRGWLSFWERGKGNCKRQHAGGKTFKGVK